MRQSTLKIPDAQFVVFDTGVESTKFIYGAENKIDQKMSLNLRVIRITEDILKFDPVIDENLKWRTNRLKKYLMFFKF